MRKLASRPEEGTHRSLRPSVDDEDHVQGAEKSRPQHEVDGAVNDQPKSAHGTSSFLDFIYVLCRHGPEWKYLHRILAHLFRSLVFEPFRWLDERLMKTRYANRARGADPVFILGYYRSGTTHLQEVLLRDPRFGYLNFYQGFFAKGFLCTEWLLKRPFNFIIRATGFLHPAHRIPFHFDLPAEEDVSMVSGAFRLASNFGQLFPRSFRYFWDKTVFFETSTADERAAFEQELSSFIDRVSVANGDKQLLLKSPPQTARVAMLKRLYPNAKFVFIHRDPYLVFVSNLKLWRTFQDVCFQQFTDAQAREHVLWSFDKVLSRYEADKQLLGPSELVEIRYEDLLADPMASLRKIYAGLQLPGFEAAAPNFQAYLDERHGQNRDRYELSAADVADVERHWGRWLTKWGYQRPGATQALRPLAANG